MEKKKKEGNPLLGPDGKPLLPSVKVQDLVVGGGVRGV